MPRVAVLQHQRLDVAQRHRRPRIATMSGRGTITSRTIVSPNSKIEWISSFSSSSISPSSDATSADARSSCSVMYGPCFKPLPGMSTLASSQQTLRERPEQRGVRKHQDRRRQQRRRDRSAGSRTSWASPPRRRTAGCVMAIVEMISPAAAEVPHGERRGDRRAADRGEQREQQHHVQVGRGVLRRSATSARAPRRRPSSTRRSARTLFMRVIATSVAARNADARRSARRCIPISSIQSVGLTAPAPRCSVPAAPTSRRVPRPLRGRSRAGAGCRARASSRSSAAGSSGVVARAATAGAITTSPSSRTPRRRPRRAGTTSTSVGPGSSM